MSFTPEELKYLDLVLHCASGFTIARGRDVVAPSVNHYRLRQKVEDQLRRIYG